MLEINPIPLSIANDKLEQNVCCALSLTGTTVKAKDIHACHQMKIKEKFVVKVKGRKQRNEVVFKTKVLKSKAEELLSLQFGQWLFLNDGICFKNQVLFYKCPGLSAV